MPPKGYRKYAETPLDADPNVPGEWREKPAPQSDAMAEIEKMKAELAAEMERVKALTAKLEQKAEIRAEVSEALRLQQEEQKRIAFGKPTPSAAPVMPPKPDEALRVVKLDRHYAPMGYYEVVGYLKEAVIKKTPAGKMEVIEPEEFIPGQKKPPNIGGVGFVTKIWAGTTLRLPESEAKDVRRAGIGSLDFD